MRILALSLTLGAVAVLSACASTEQRVTNQTATATTATKTQTTNSPASPAGNDVPLAPAHGGGTSTTAPAASNTSPEETGMDTAALDAKIAKAEEKAKAKEATEADKLAAAAAYLERADIFMNAGKPTLYKFALRDYRRTLHYQPGNKQAQDSANMIVSIYKSMGRPVPELGNEP